MSQKIFLGTGDFLGHFLGHMVYFPGQHFLGQEDVMAVRCPRCGEALVVEVRRFRGGRKAKKGRSRRGKAYRLTAAGKRAKDGMLAEQASDVALVKRRREQKEQQAAPAGGVGPKAEV